MKIAIGADHAGFELKEKLKSYLEKAGHTVKDFGTHSTASVDYPDFAHPTALAVENKEFEYGVLICGSANGVAITANKHQGIRAAICWTEEVGAIVRKHNDANIVCLPARFVTTEEAEKILTAFLTTAFEGGRHATRVGKINC